VKGDSGDGVSLLIFFSSYLPSLQTAPLGMSTTFKGALAGESNIKIGNLVAYEHL
jgi:hypothetical protein